MGIAEWSATQGLVLWPLLNVVSGRLMSMGINEWSATQGPVLWPLLNVVSWRQMFHGHQWMKYYPSTSHTAITECCDLETDVPLASMKCYPARDQPYGHNYVVICRSMFHGHWWMKYWPSTSPMAIAECCDLIWDIKSRRANQSGP
jgi:hypothetical protein